MPILVVSVYVSVYVYVHHPRGVCGRGNVSNEHILVVSVAGVLNEHILVVAVAGGVLPQPPRTAGGVA